MEGVTTPQEVHIRLLDGAKGMARVMAKGITRATATATARGMTTVLVPMLVTRLAALSALSHDLSNRL